jgi:aldose 1-epimerase
MSGSAECSCRKSSFGKLPDGRNVDLFALINKNRVKITVTNFGAAVVSIIVPDKNGVLGDIALGYDSVDGYRAGNNPFLGAVVGRYGNRIAHGKFTLNGKTCTLAINNGVNHLHGGPGGFDKVLWNVGETVEGDTAEVALSYTSPDGEEGYPGTLKTTVRYKLTNNNELVIDYAAVTDADTVVNLTNHTYFNLKGKGSIVDHLLKLHAEHFTPVDSTQIPTGEIRTVVGTPFDFRKPVKIGQRIDTDDEQIAFGSGYDHNFIISTDNKLKSVGSVYCEATGRLLEVSSTEPGVQFYSGNFLEGSPVGKNGLVYEKRSGFCLETQHYPDSPNKPMFPSTVLKAGAKFTSCTIYRFAIADGIV